MPAYWHQPVLQFISHQRIISYFCTAKGTKRNIKTKPILLPSQNNIYPNCRGLCCLRNVLKQEHKNERPVLFHHEVQTVHMHRLWHELSYCRILFFFFLQSCEVTCGLRSLIQGKHWKSISTEQVSLQCRKITSTNKS